MWITDKKLPVKLSRIHKNRESFRIMLEPLLGTTPNRTEVLSIMEAFTRKFPDFQPHPSWGGMYKTLEGYVIGRPVTQDIVDNLASVLAGNETDLRIGKVIPPSPVHSGDKFILARISDCFSTFKGEEEPRIHLVLDFLTTEHAGGRLKTVVSRKTARRLETHLGLRPRYNKSRMHYRQIVGCYVFARMFLSEDTVYVADWAITSTLAGRNRKLHKARIPRTRECPMGFTHTCHMCPVGGSPRQSAYCGLSTHQTHYSESTCTRCDEVGLVDGTSPSGHCLDCEKLLWGGK